MPNHPNWPSKEHQFKPGSPPGPGRPRGRRDSLEARLRKMLKLKYTTDKKGRKVPIPDGQDVGDLLMKALLTRALAGELPHIKEILERIDGKVVERHEVETVETESASQFRSELQEIWGEMEPGDGGEGPDASGRPS